MPVEYYVRQESDFDWTKMTRSGHRFDKAARRDSADREGSGLVAQLRDVLSAGVANDGSRLTINLRLETEPGSLVETGFEAGPLAASVLTQALLTMYVSMREKLAAAAGDNERARALAPAVAVKVASFEIDRGESDDGRWEIALTLKLQKGGELVLGLPPTLARDLCASLASTNRQVPSEPAQYH